MRTLKYVLVDAAKHKASVNQLYFIGEFLQEKFKNKVFVKLDNRYADYFPEDSNYFGRALRLLKSMCGMTNRGKLFADELTEWLLESGFIQYQCHIPIYYERGPSLGIPFFYAPYHLSEQQSCEPIISTNFSLIFIFK